MKTQSPFLLLVIVAILAVAFSSFSPDGKNRFPGYKQIENGTYILFHTKGAGVTTVDTGGAVFVKIKFKTAADSVFLDINVETKAASYPMRVDKAEFKGDFLDIFLGLHAGDSVSFFMKLDSLKAHYPEEFKLEPRYDTMEYLGFSVKVDSIYSRDLVAKLREEAAAATKKQDELNKKIRDAEPAVIEKYIVDNHIKQKPSPEGLYYIEAKEGKGKKVEAGQLIKVRYNCKYLDGTIIDSNMEPDKELYEFVVGSNDVIAGFDEGVRSMKKGGKATLIIPSKLAYGDGAGRMKPYATLIFEIELVEVWDPK